MLLKTPKSSKGVVKLHQEPKLVAPYLIASWPGVGNVSLIVTRHLRENLGFVEMGEIHPGSFFEPSGVLVRENVVQTPQFPESRFYYWHRGPSGHDLILFLGEEQPASRGYEMGSAVLEVARKFGVKRVYTFAAALSRLRPSENPRVWVTCTRKELLEELGKHSMAFKGDLHIAGLNGLLLGIAKEQGMDGVCLLGEVPAYATRVPNPKAALAILGMLADMLEFKVDTEKLKDWARESDEEMKKLAAQAMGEFIDHFTKPLWEREGEDS